MKEQFTDFKRWLADGLLRWFERVDAFWAKEEVLLQQNPSRWHWRCTFAVSGIVTAIFVLSLVAINTLGGK